MTIARKEITYYVLDKKNFMDSTHLKAKKFIIANENSESIVSEDDEEAIEILKRAADAFKV